MRCGNCDKTDGLCYTSNPPKVKCTITGEFHEYGDECDAFRTAEIVKPLYGVSCMICNETIRTSEYPPIYDREICNKCRAAVLAMRKRIERVTEMILD